ncbi:MAG: tryptophan-rich sensory protein [Clostridiaceae bacterium]
MSRIQNAWVNLLFLAVTLVINTFGAIGLINGLSQKQISDMYLTLITPSPATFRIWSVIYSFLLIAMIVMIIKKDDHYYQRAIDNISLLFRISCILNVAWIVSFSFLLVEISVLFILGFVNTLALISLKLLKIREGKRWLLPVSFGLYGGWLFIATVVNTAAALIKMKWSGFGLTHENWGCIMLVVAILLLVGVLLKIRNAVFPLPLAWAYFGIYQFLQSPEGFKGVFATLQTVSLVGMVVLTIISAVLFYRNHFSVLPEASNK